MISNTNLVLLILSLVGGAAQAACSDAGLDDTSGEATAPETQHALTLETDDGRRFYDGSLWIEFREDYPASIEVGVAGVDPDGVSAYRFQAVIARPIVASSLNAAIPAAVEGRIDGRLAIECYLSPCEVVTEIATAPVEATFNLRDRDDAAGRIDDSSGALSADVRGPWSAGCMVFPETLGLTSSSLISDEAWASPFCQAAAAELGVRPSIGDATDGQGEE